MNCETVLPTMLINYTLRHMRTPTVTETCALRLPTAQTL